ncbi:hypothetical protein ACFLSZ_02390 [Candidatus Bipolaricaulota bacterium]
MSQATSINHVEMKAMRATIRDGITELQLGSMLLVFGVLLYLVMPFAVFGALFPLVLVPTGSFLKRRFVYPRIGYAKVARQPHAIRGIVIAAIVFLAVLLTSLGVFALILGFDRGSSLWLSHFVPAFTGAMLAIGPWVVARTYRLIRWYVFAALFILAGICLPLFHIATGYAAVALECAVVGGLSLSYGLGLFLTFLRKYPVEDPSHAGE